MYSEIGNMHIADPVRDCLGFSCSSAKTKSVSAVMWDLRVVLLENLGM